MQPSDYCVSLEMAQRPELHAAMKAAGCDQPMLSYRDGVIVDSVYCQVMTEMRGFPPDFVAEIEGRAPTQDEADARRQWDLAQPEINPAYHLGELICAAVKLAAMTHNAPLVEYDQTAVGNGRAALYNRVEIDSADELCSYAADHAPDAVALLVMALAAGVRG